MRAVRAPRKVCTKPQPRQTSHENGSTQSDPQDAMGHISDGRNITASFANTARGSGSAGSGSLCGCSAPPHTSYGRADRSCHNSHWVSLPRSVKGKPWLVTFVRQACPRHQLGHISEVSEQRHHPYARRGDRGPQKQPVLPVYLHKPFAEEAAWMCAPGHTWG